MNVDSLKAKIDHLFSFDQETGFVYHRQSHGRALVDSRVGWTDEKGYRRTKLNGKTFFLHKLIWLHFFGVYPEEIDHRDGNTSNNTLRNLRVATRSENLANAPLPTGISGTRGVYFNSESAKWRSMIGRGGQRYFLGDFETIEEAAAAYRIAADQLYGEFAYHNRASLRRI